MTAYTLTLFQEAYPEQVEINKCRKEGGRVYAQFWLLNEDKTRHMPLFDGIFPSEEAINKAIQEWLDYKL